MRGARALGVVVAAVVLVAAVLAAGRGPTRASGPQQERASAVPAPARPQAGGSLTTGPGDRDIRFCEQEQGCRAVRERTVLELASRLRGDPAAAGDATAVRSGDVERRVRAARRRQAAICPAVRRNNCTLAVASSTIRQQWRALHRRASRRSTAEVLVALGARIGLNGTDVVNAVRAELDTQLIRAVDGGLLPAGERTRALRCFDELLGCAAPR